MLAQCYDPSLEAQRQKAEAKVVELEAEYTSQFVTDRAKAQIVRERLESERASLTLVRTRASDLVVRANTDGVFVVPQAADLVGRYYRKGELLGYVIGEVRPIARVIIPQDTVDRVRLSTDRVRVRLVDQPQSVLKGTVLREVPGGTEYLPSAALSVEGGGEIATDPRDTKGPKALQRMFQFDIELKGMARTDHFGQRVFVRF